MWQTPSAGTVATHLGVGWRFPPGQAAQGPIVAPVAWQLDVWSLQSIHWQSRSSTCPVAATVTDWLCRLWQAMTGSLPVSLSCQLVGGRHTIRAAAVTCAPSDLAQTQASGAAQHLGCISDCQGQPVNTTFRCLRAKRNHGVLSFVTTSFTTVIIYLTPRPLGEANSVEDRQGHDSQ